MFVKNSYIKMFLFICILIVSVYSFSASQTNKTNKTNRTKWYEYYLKARDFAESEDWNTTIDLLQKAIEKEPEPKEQKRTYGIYSIDYYPYLELGKAYLEIGKKEDASRVCKKAEEKGAAPEEEVKKCLTRATSTPTAEK